MAYDGQWVEDPHAPRGWRWAEDAPAADPAPTHILPTHPGAPMLDDPAQPIPSSRAVYDPGLDRTGDESRNGPSLLAMDHLPDYNSGQTWAAPSAQATRDFDPLGHGPGSELVACPCCGTGVAPDRIRD